MSIRLSSSEQEHTQRRSLWCWKVHAKRLALLATTLLILVGGAEIAVRLFTDTIPPLTVRDPLVGQHYVPSFEETVLVPESARRVHLRFNRSGFRGPNRPEEKPPGVRRVAILGDSMIASVAVDEEDTLVRQLEGMLNDSNSEVEWEVLNFGVSGASPGQEMTLYKEVVSRYSPDVVLCAYYVGNDLADNSSRLSNNPRIYWDVDEQGQLYQRPFSVGRAKASHYLNRYSRFYVWQKVTINTLLKEAKQTGGVMSPGEWIFCRRESDNLDHAWRLTDEINRAFQKEVTDDGALFAIVLLPSASQVYEDVFQKTLDVAPGDREDFDWNHPNERLEALCDEAGVPLVTMLSDFREAAPAATAKAEDEWLFLRGVGHFNERGERLAAEVVHRFLTQGVQQETHVACQPFVTQLR